MIRKRTSASKRVGDFAPAAEKVEIGMTEDPNRDRLDLLFDDVSSLRRQAMGRALLPFGLTSLQWQVLAFLSQSDGSSQTGLAKQLDRGAVGMGRLIDRLETIGLVSRRCDKADRRIRRVFLTEQSRNLVGRIRQSLEASENEVIEKLDKADREAAVRALSAMKARLRAAAELADAPTYPA